MAFSYLTLFTALVISLSAAVYSILGLTAIFAAAFWPIVVMGGSLEFGKIVTTLWLHKYWDRVEVQYKIYLCSAVAILMLLTSMGVFGFLSKAHTDQNLVSGDVQSKISIYDEKIKISKDNIEAARKALAQLDVAVDQTMSRSNDERGAERAVQIRRGQQAERNRLIKDIESEQKKITVLNEESAPIRAEVRKVEAEVGPLKYIAALIYGDNPEANVLEKSVRWVIILIVIVFDPLALVLLLAATKSIEWERGINIFAPKRKKEEEPVDEQSDVEANLKKDTAHSTTDDDLLTASKIKEISKSAELVPTVVVEEPVTLQQQEPVVEEPVMEEPTKIVQQETVVEEQIVEEPAPEQQEPVIEDTVPQENPLERVLAEVERRNNIDDEPTGTDLQKQIMITWKEANPGETFKKYRKLKQDGVINTLPWDEDSFVGMFILNEKELSNYKKALSLVADNAPPVLTTVTSFGTSLPEQGNKGDLFLRIDKLPTVLYKFNGSHWIVVDKDSTDSYVYDSAYIEYLIDRIATGQYDPDLLSDAEREQIALKLTN